MFVVTVSFVIAQEHVDEFAVAMRQQAENSLTIEPECHVFDVCFSMEDERSVFLYEKYTDAAAFDVHLASEHFKNFNTLVTPWVDSKVVITWHDGRNA